MLARALAALAISLIVTAVILTAVHAVFGDVAWWRHETWVKTWLAIAALTAIPSGAAKRR
jgi:hypothetical protein